MHFIEKQDGRLVMGLPDLFLTFGVDVDNFNRSENESSDFIIIKEKMICGVHGKLDVQFSDILKEWLSLNCSL